MINLGDPNSRHAACHPSLPPGYSGQEAWGFRDPTGRFSYQFFRVYGPPDSPVDHRGGICRIDEALSYWVVIWRTFGGAANGRPEGRWITYAQAKKLCGPGMTFSRFSSPLQEGDEIPRLLRVSEIAIEAQPGLPPAETPGPQTGVAPTPPPSSPPSPTLPTPLSDRIVVTRA